MNFAHSLYTYDVHIVGIMPVLKLILIGGSVWYLTFIYLM